MTPKSQNSQKSDTSTSRVWKNSFINNSERITPGVIYTPVFFCILFFCILPFLCIFFNSFLHSIYSSLNSSYLFFRRIFLENIYEKLCFKLWASTELLSQASSTFSRLLWKFNTTDGKWLIISESQNVLTIPQKNRNNYLWHETF